MKRTITIGFVLLFALQTFAASTATYVVALKRTIGTLRPTAILRDVDGAATRPFDALATMDAFATELTADEAATLRHSAGVRYVERVAERHALGTTPPLVSDAVTRNLFGQTVPFGLDMVRARDLWNLTHGDDINVVVIDTGVDYRHPDLVAAYAGGYNTYTKNSDPLDDNGHGTHVAGTIAAADNDIGVVGVAPRVRLWAVKVLDSTGSGSTAKVLAGLDWVIQRKKERGGDWIVNLSLGSDETNVAEQEGFARAVDAGLLICAASGNESEVGVPAAVGYPAAYRGVLAIGAVTDQNQIATFSNQGPELAVVGPGVGILSTVKLGSGTLAAVRATSSAFAGAQITLSKKGVISGEFVACGAGRPEDFPASIKGRIAVIQRGAGVSFNQKTRNAKAAGAIAVVIYNNDNSPLNWTLANDSDPTASTFEWPVAIALAQADGEALLRERGNITVSFADDDYAVYNGTSMATPHAAGVAALVWSLARNAPAADVRRALTSTATDLGDGGFDAVYGYGLLDALHAAKFLAPGSFASPALPAPVIPTRRRAVSRH